MAYCIQEVYTNKQCLQLKEELITSVNNSYCSNEIYETKGQKWYINTKGYIHFIKGQHDILLTDSFTFKY